MIPSRCHLAATLRVGTRESPNGFRVTACEPCSSCDDNWSASPNERLMLLEDPACFHHGNLDFVLSMCNTALCDTYGEVAPDSLCPMAPLPPPPPPLHRPPYRPGPYAPRYRGRTQSSDVSLAMFRHRMPSHRVKREQAILDRRSDELPFLLLSPLATPGFLLRFHQAPPHSQLPPLALRVKDCGVNGLNGS